MRDDPFHGVAYSYIRFSAKEQDRGDSIRRQRALRDDWLALNPGVSLDTSLGGEDRGVSAFRGRNRTDKHHLGRFLEAVRVGRVTAGSILLLESLDRLSRQEEEEALALLLGLLNSGIVIVQLEPYTVFRKGDGMMGLMRALIYLSRAREESATKSVRVATAWRNKQKNAAEGKVIITRRCPAWLEIADGRFRFKAGAKEVLRRIYAECAAGRGARMIARDLDKEQVTHFASARWQSSYITTILNKREPMGEYQAYRKVNGKRTKNGPPVPDYFPVAVTVGEWQAAQKAIKSRKRKGGRRGTDGWVALFSPVFDAETGERLQSHRRHCDGHRYRVLQQAGVGAWGGRCNAFPLASFEAAVLSRLAELDLRDVLPPRDGANQVAELAGRVAEVEARIAHLQGAMIEGDQDGAALPVLRELDRRRLDLVNELAAAERQAAGPAVEQWQTLKDLAAAVAADNNARLRVRAAAGRLVERIDVLIVPGANRRIAAVQVRLAERDITRRYVILHENAKGGRYKAQAPPTWWARSFADAGCEGLDLLNAEQREDLKKTLAALMADATSGVQPRRRRLKRAG